MLSVHLPVLGEEQFVRGDLEYDISNLGSVFLFWDKAVLMGSFTGVTMQASLCSFCFPGSSNANFAD